MNSDRPDQVTQSEFALLAAHTSLALRALKLAIMGLHVGRPDVVTEQLAKFDDADARIWEAFEQYQASFEKTQEGKKDE